jgi:tRNA threonylcarbamoyl adenosine modification protein (Sua5/YciO/YrdC/YwlC family)
MRRVEFSEHYVRPDRIAEVAEALRRGELVAIPTDTTWAIVADALTRQSVQRLQDLRRRMSPDRADDRAPMSLLCGSLGMIGTYVLMDQPDFRLARRLLPGPYTMLFRASRQVPRQLQSKRKVVGVRMPDHPIALPVLEALDHPVLAATAYIEGEPVRSSTDLIDRLGDAIDLIADGVPVWPASTTVLDCTSGAPVVLRKGRGPIEDDWASA